MTFSIRKVESSDVERCYEIESASFGVEAATQNAIANRVKVYPDGFLVAVSNHIITGFINGCCSHSHDLSDSDIKAMVGHDTGGNNLIIFSLVTAPEYRNQGYARALIEHYLHFADTHDKNVYLMCKKQHMSLYKKFGFSELGLSKSTHGGKEWFEMARMSHA